MIILHSFFKMQSIMSGILFLDTVYIRVYVARKVANSFNTNNTTQEKEIIIITTAEDGGRWMLCDNRRLFIDLLVYQQDYAKITGAFG